MVLNIVKGLLKHPKKKTPGIRPVAAAEIGIISPYAGQVKAITDAVTSQKIPVCKNGNEDDGSQACSGIEVKSVDGYQVGALGELLSWTAADSVEVQALFSKPPSRQSLCQELMYSV